MEEKKPFAYIDLMKPKKKKVIGHKRINEKNDHKTETGKIIFSMRVTSEYLFVGDGRQELFKPARYYGLEGFEKSYQEPYYRFFRSRNRLAIPSSSLKGAIRSYAEAISNSCVSVKSDIDQQIKRLEEYPTCTVDENEGNIWLCPCCCIFGTTDYQGHVSFSDAFSTNNSSTEIIKIYELFEPKRLKNKKKNRKIKFEIPKRKFYENRSFEKANSDPKENYRYIETFPKGSTFSFALFFENVTREDLSLVFHSMGINQGFEIKVGGAKPRCLGNVSFEAKKVILIDELFNGHIEKPKKFIEERLNCDELVKNLAELKNKLSSELECPEGNY